MKKIYPKKSRYLKFFRANDMSIMKDLLTDEEWKIPIPVAEFINSLDGKTDPNHLNCYGFDPSDILDFMEEQDLFDRNDKYLNMGSGTIYISLWYPNIKNNHHVISFIWNQFLILLWSIILIIGLWIVAEEKYIYVDGNWWVSLLGLFVGLVLGMVFHELSHVAATLNYGGTLLEVGVMILHYIPGAYCMIDYDNVMSRFKRIQISAAGIECNFLLCGIFLCLLNFNTIPSDCLFFAAETNAFLGLLNLSLNEGLDGCEIFEEILGCSNFVTKAKLLVNDKKRKKSLRRQGINGYAKLIACYILTILQILPPLLISTQLLIAAFILV